MARGFPKIIDLLCVFLLYWTLPSSQAERHSLYYIYTGLSKPVDRPGIYEFTAMGLLDDTQIDYYNSKEKRTITKQPWMKDKLSEDYWKGGTVSRKRKEQWFNKSIQILMKRMGHKKSDLHVLQWRVGCEVEQQGSEVKFLKGVSEYGYDGENFLSFNDREAQWVAPVDEALPTKRKWDNIPKTGENYQAYLGKKCVQWLKDFREYGDEELRKTYPPDVHVFAKKSTNNETKLNLTCLATGFYPKDVMMIIREDHTSLAEDQIESSGIRPNHDGSYQLRKSVEIEEDKKAEYGCLMTHRTLNGSIIFKWDGTCKNCPLETDFIYIGVVIGLVVTLLVIGFVLYMLHKNNIIGFQKRNSL